MIDARNEPVVRGPALAVHNAPLMPGWHLIEAEITGTEATAAGTYLTTIEAVVSDVPVVISAPALSPGRWSFVFALERASDGVTLFADGSAHGLVVVTMSVTRHE